MHLVHFHGDSLDCFSGDRCQGKLFQKLGARIRKQFTAVCLIIIDTFAMTEGFSDKLLDFGVIIPVAAVDGSPAA